MTVMTSGNSASIHARRIRSMAHAVRGVAAVMALASYHSRGASGLRGRRRMGSIASKIAAARRNPSIASLMSTEPG